MKHLTTLQSFVWPHTKALATFSRLWMASLAWLSICGQAGSPRRKAWRKWWSQPSIFSGLYLQPESPEIWLTCTSLAKNSPTYSKAWLRPQSSSHDMAPIAAILRLDLFRSQSSRWSQKSCRFSTWSLYDDTLACPNFKAYTAKPPDGSKDYQWLADYHWLLQSGLQSCLFT